MSRQALHMPNTDCAVDSFASREVLQITSDLLVAGLALANQLLEQGSRRHFAHWLPRYRGWSRYMSDCRHVVTLLAFCESRAQDRRCSLVSLVDPRRVVAKRDRAVSVPKTAGDGS